MARLKIQLLEQRPSSEGGREGDGGCEIWEIVDAGRELVEENIIANEKRVVAKDEYEGGNEVWECSRDLSDYIHENVSLREPHINRVLELGCGHATPTAQLLTDLYNNTCKEKAAQNTSSDGTDDRKSGPHFVNEKLLVCQDLNRSVLLTSTFDVLSNIKKPSLAADCHAVRVVLLPCTWNSLLNSFLDHHLLRSTPQPSQPSPMAAVRFDLILSAETLYRPENFEIMARLLLHRLQPGSGRAIFAQKKFYFGVGGGSAPFIAFLNATFPGTFEIQTLDVLNNGRSNVRDIISISLPVGATFAGSEALSGK